MTQPSSKSPKDGLAKSEDVVLVHGHAEDGNGYQVLRKRGDVVEAGLVRPVEEGRPLHGDLVRLSPRPDFPLLCDVEVLHEGARASSRDDVVRSGPAQVASEEYREGWAAIWGGKPRDAKAPKGLPN